MWSQGAISPASCARGFKRIIRIYNWAATSEINMCHKIILPRDKRSKNSLFVSRVALLTSSNKPQLVAFP